LSGAAVFAAHPVATEIWLVGLPAYRVAALFGLWAGRRPGGVIEGTALFGFLALAWGLNLLCVTSYEAAAPFHYC